MSLSALFKRLKAVESRPSVQRPLRILGGLPSGAEMIQSLAAAAVRAPKPLAPSLADDLGSTAAKVGGAKAPVAQTDSRHKDKV